MNNADLIQEANVLLQQGHLLNAFQMYQQALIRDPQCFDAMMQLSYLAARLGRRQLSMHLTTRALEINPGSAEASNNMAVTLHDAGHYSEALQWYMVGLEQRPGFSELYVNMAGTLNKLGHFQEALTCCEKALQIEPDCSSAFKKMADIYFELGDLPAAEDCCRRAYQLDPKNQYAYSLIKALAECNSYKVVSVKDWCVKRNQEYQPLVPERIMQVNKPHFYEEQLTLEERGYCQGGETILPEMYIAKITDALVFAHSDFVISGEHCLYDERAMGEGRYPLRNRVLKAANRSHVWLPRHEKTVEIDEAIHFCGDHSENYFHWILEYLPRLMLVEKNASLKDVPLIVDAGLPPSMLAALDQLKGRRAIHFASPGIAYHVRTLHLPSSPSMMHDNYNYPKNINDCIAAPEAVQYLRDQFMPSNEIKPDRKLFISRDRSARRNLINQDEIENFLMARGFETIRPEKLNFSEQVSMFAQAKVIVSSACAALANVAFAQKECKVITFSTKFVHGYYCFSMLADITGVNLGYVLGDAVFGSHPLTIHEDFSVPLEYLENALAQIGV